MFGEMTELGMSTYFVVHLRRAIVCEPTNIWDLEILGVVMTSCVIINNMTMGDDSDGVRNVDSDRMGKTIAPSPSPP